MSLYNVYLSAYGKDRKNRVVRVRAVDEEQAIETAARLYILEWRGRSVERFRDTAEIKNILSEVYGIETELWKNVKVDRVEIIKTEKPRTVPSEDALARARAFRAERAKR